LAPPDLADHVFVVLAYGDSPFLRDCLASLAAQSLPSPIVVVTSTPSAFISRAARDHGVPVVVNPRREDIAGDWNFGLGAARARHVTLAHQDDTYAPDFLEKTRAAFAGRDGVLCFTGYQEIDDRGEPKSSKVSKAKHLIEALTLGGRRAVRGAALRAFLSFGNPLPCSSVTFDMARLGGFAFSRDFASNLDWDAWWRLMAAGETFLRAPARLVGRRHNPLTATARLLRDGTRGREDLVMFRRAWPRPLADVIAFAYRAGY
jgi:glycosyltransferase involved in cell wall biosynthesis